MSKIMFVLNSENGQIGAEYKNGLFPQIPNYHKRDSWFLLTEGITDDIIVNDRTTIKEIRSGQYKRLVEISKNTIVFTHTFNSSCRETSYTFKVTIKANVYVGDPIKFYNNIKNISVQDFLNNQFSLEVKDITRKYSILNYNGIDDELTRVLTASVVSDETTGLSYRITTVITEPNDEAKNILKKRDDMTINHEMSLTANMIATINRTKTYADAILEEAAKGTISHVEAIRLIEEYEEQTFEKKIEKLKKLKEEDILTETDYIAQAASLLPALQQNAMQVEKANTSNLDALFESED